MEAQLKALDLDPLTPVSILTLLEEGKPLSKKQAEELFGLISHERKENELMDVFQKSPLRFLQSIDLSYKENAPENGKKELRLKDLSRFAALLLRFVTPDSYSLVMDLCSRAMTEDSIYLHLYMNVAVTYCYKSDAPVNVLLPFLGSSNPDVVMHVAFALYHFLKKNPSTELLIGIRLKSILDCELSEVTKEDFLLLCAAFEVFLPSTPKSLVPLYCSEACKRLFLYRGLILDPDHYGEDSAVAEKLLKVISVSCTYDEARKFNSLHYLQFLIGGTKVQTSNNIVALSCLCLVKIWDFTTLEKKVSVQSILSDVVRMLKDVESTNSCLEPLIECLIYLTLSATLRTIIRNDSEVITKLLTILETTDAPLIRYGIITVFSNLTKISSPDASKEDETKSYLKEMAEAQKTGQKKEDVVLTQNFNKGLVNTKLVPLILKACTTSQKSTEPVVKILYYLTVRQKHDVLLKLGQYGSCDKLLGYLLDHSSLDKESGTTKSSSEELSVVETRSDAIKALASIARSFNPEKLFEEYTPKISVPFFVELLGQKSEPGSIQQSPSAFTSLDLLVGLLALTNLCAIRDSELHKLVVQKTFDQVVAELIFDGTRPEIQRAAWELVNNLMENPFMLAKFFNQESPSSRRNLALLVMFLDSEDPALQEIIAGLMANATSEYALVVDSLVADKDIFRNLCQILGSVLNEQSQESGLMYRIGFFLHNLTSSKAAVTVISTDHQLKTGLLKVIQDSTDSEVQMIFAEVVQTILKK